MHKQFQSLRAELMAQFPERKDVIDGSLCALLASENVMLIGPPGTAKSALVRRLAHSFDARVFDVLLTRFTSVEEVWGPISLRSLENDSFVRITKGRLADCEIGFVDEVFRGSSAILNTLLTVANEKVFHNDGVPCPVPLISLFGATNNLPDGNELEAIFDRFLLRFDVQYLLVASNLRSVLAAGAPTTSTRLTLDDLRRGQANAAAVRVTDETIDALLQIRDALKSEGLTASDRRWKRSLKLVQASAWLSGETRTSPEDLNLLVDALWRDPRDRPKVARIVGNLSDPASTQATEILDAAREIATKVASLKSGDRKAYVAQAVASVTSFDEQQVRLAELAKSAGRRAKAVIADAVAEIQGLHAEMARAVAQGMGIGGSLRSLR